VFQYVGPNGYIPSSIAGAVYSSGYTADRLDLNGDIVAIDATGAVGISGQDVSI
jgi:hypothetical protein